MRSLGLIFRKLTALFSRRQFENDLDAELAFHLAMRQEEEIRRGSHPQQAALASRRRFGSMLNVKEQSRDAWLFAWLESVLQDVRFAVRGLRRAPTFALVAITVLAVGIGGAVAIFSAVNAVLLRPLPFKDSDRVVYVQGNRGPLKPGAMSTLLRTLDLPWLRQASQTLSSFSILLPRAVKVDGIGVDGEQINARRAWISAAAFGLFDQRPFMGRALEPRDEEPNAELVLVLSYGAWQRFFGGAADVLGRRLSLGGFPHTVIGVMPRGFAFPTPDVEMWSAWTLPPGGTAVVPIARLNDGVSLQAATAEINALLVRMYPMFGRPDLPPPLKLVPVKQQMVAPVRSALLVMLFAVGLVLLIACSNIATLLLARAAGRRREIGIRSSLGAARWRIGQQVLTESLVLGLAGGVAGTALAYGLVHLLPAMPLANVPRLHEIKVDETFLLTGLVTTVVTSLLFGSAPLLRMIDRRFAHSTRTAAGFSASSAPSLGRNRSRTALTVVQVALAVMLLIAAGLLGGSFVHLARFDLGYDPDDVLTFTVPMSPTRYSDAQQRELHAQLLDRLQAMTTARAAIAARLPTQPGGTFGGLVQLPGSLERVPAQLRPVSRKYFDVLRIPILQGRGFDDTDRPGQSPVVVVSQHLAAAFPEGRALGRTVQLGGGPFERIPLRVVGVARDVVASSVEAVVRPDMYILFDQSPAGPQFQDPLRSAFYILRADADPTSLVSTIRGLVNQIDSGLAVDNMSTLEDLLTVSVAQPRMNAVLLSVFAAFAVLLTAIAMYGLLAYMVTERTQEIGIRMAVGAGAGDVLMLILRQSVLLVVPGILLGLGGAAMLTRYLETMLFGLTPLDPRTFGIVPIAMFVVMLLASYVPARRATQVDPIVALRCE